MSRILGEKSGHSVVIKRSEERISKRNMSGDTDIFNLWNLNPRKNSRMIGDSWSSLSFALPQNLCLNSLIDGQITYSKLWRLLLHYAYEMQIKLMLYCPFIKSLSLFPDYKLQEEKTKTWKEVSSFRWNACPKLIFPLNVHGSLLFSLE